MTAGTGDGPTGRAPLQAAVDGRPLRVLMATARYLPERGGTEIHVHEVARRLAARGADVTVLSTAPDAVGATDGREGPIRVVRVRAWPPQRDYYFAPGLARVVRRHGADIVHCQGYHTFVAPIVMAAALGARIPYVVTLHSGGHSSRLRRRLRPAQARLMTPLLRRAARIVAGSRFEAELFAERTGLPASAFVVVPSGVDLPPTEPQERDPHRPLILSIGRVESYKGHHRVLEAMPLLAAARPGSRLRVVGTGPAEPELRRLAERLGVDQRLQIEPVPADRRDDMSRLLQRAACVAMLSEYESQGLAIQEALALGCPLVASEGSALDDLADHANVRLLPLDASSAQIAAAIGELIDVPRQEPPALATWDQCAESLLELYLDAVARGGRGRPGEAAAR